MCPTRSLTAILDILESEYPPPRAPPALIGSGSGLRAPVRRARSSRGQVRDAAGVQGGAPHGAPFVVPDAQDYAGGPAAPPSEETREGPPREGHLAGLPGSYPQPGARPELAAVREGEGGV